MNLGLLGPEHAGDEAVALDEAPLDETQPVVLPVVWPNQEDRLSRAIRLELERLRFEREKPNVDSGVPELDLQIEHLADDVVYAAPAPVIEHVFPISDVSAATTPKNEYAAPTLLVCRQKRKRCGRLLRTCFADLERTRRSVQ